MPIKDYNFVFDLDDTLYNERDYVHSALRFCGRLVTRLYAIADPATALMAAFEEGVPDPIGAYWAEQALPIAAKAGMISAMRAHIPDIALAPSTKALIAELRGKGAGFAILTDGRSLTQRAKISALGLLGADVICISEEIGAEKPSEKGFWMIQAQASGRQNIYIGDNSQKDFVAPNAMGWHSILLKDNGRNIRRAPFNPAIGSAPQISIDRLPALLEIFTK